MKKTLFGLIALLLSVLSLSAQSTQTSTEKEMPTWVQMMDTPGVNYYEAIRLFEQYWANKEKPFEEHDLFSASNEEKEEANFVYAKKSKQSAEARQLAFQYKRFLRWKQKMLPFVKQDGRIMNEQERIAQWQLQHENRK